MVTLARRAHLGETCRHTIVVQTCSLVKMYSCCIDMGTRHHGRLGKGIGDVMEIGRHKS